MRQDKANQTKHAANAMAKNTIRAYDRQWRQFITWCVLHGLEALPADGKAVALYLAYQDSKGLSVATMQQGLAAIGKAHRKADHPVPGGTALEDTWKGLRRKRGTAPKRKARPVEAKDLRKMLKALEGDRLIDIRDRALLLLGFAGAFRRSELAGLRCEDLEFKDEGVVVTLGRTKTDQEGKGRQVGIPKTLGKGLHPVEALVLWQRSSGVEDGPLFQSIDRHGNLGWRSMSDRSIARIVKRAAERAGLDASKISGHSLRAGLVTSAAKAGKNLAAIMAQTGHRSTETVIGYVRQATLFEDNAAEDL
jgi:integrase